MTCPTAVMVKVHKAQNIEDMTLGHSEKIEQQLDVDSGFLEGRIPKPELLEVNADIVELGLSKLAGKLCGIKKQDLVVIPKLQKMALACSSSTILPSQAMQELQIFASAIEIHQERGNVKISAASQGEQLSKIEQMSKQGRTVNAYNKTQDYSNDLDDVSCFEYFS